jgi:protein-S-isoprenylcysteine O-methyltransferase Ste14
MVLIKTIIFSLLVPGTVTLLIPYWLLSSSAQPPIRLGVFRYLGVLPILIGAAIYFWCAWDFTFAGGGTPAPIDPPKELVVRGLYRYVRNPMYLGILSILLGEALLFASWRLVEYTAVVFTFFFLFVTLYEEPSLRQKFGDSYRRYCKSVPRWIPWRSSSTAPSSL